MVATAVIRKEVSMMKMSTEPQGRREFLKRAAVTGGAVTVAAVGTKAAGAAEAVSGPAPETVPESRGYRMTSHIERYYRLARF